jgi:hypothetical protein
MAKSREQTARKEKKSTLYSLCSKLYALRPMLMKFVAISG